jgi:inorganic pyrophosphatase/K(+)-stimulated pyrophosphate-energized sodium pump
VLHAQSRWVPFAFLTGGFFSGLAGWFGMKTATYASNRTAAGAQKSLNAGLQVAFRSGAVMGLTVVGLGLLDICLWFAVLYWVVPMVVSDPAQHLSLVDITVTMLCFGMGASSQALFARVGGGIFTKAADVGADLVGKVEQGIPEDDPRNPATIADNVGDNVGDVAGMGADLYESYCGSILATAALGVAAYSGSTLVPAGMEAIDAQLQALLLPLAIAGIGIFLSIVGIYLVRTEESATQRTLLKALGRGINASTFLVAIAALGLAWWLMPRTEGTLVGGVLPGVAFSVIVGLLAGWLIGKWTEYSTSDEYGPTKRLADQALTGPATVIIGGIADGMLSVWFPVLVVCVGMVSAFGFATGWNFADMNYFALGLYGVGIAAVGMLSTLGITLATDAYGPIADNAGGNAEMSHLEPYVRQRTDALDSLGNTTAATGKGFAIGSAALTALALLAAYVEEVRIGFERWGESTVATGGALVSAPDGFYKASTGFVIQKTGNKTDTFMAMPSDTRHPLIDDKWSAITFTSKEPGTIPADMLTFDAETQTTKFADTGSPLIRVHNATLPDFTSYYDGSVMNPKVLVGVLLGAMATFVFCALTMKAVGRAAKGMVEEVRRQFKEKPGIMEGTEKPDYARPVAISTQAAQR